jgi:3D (Asp-Asp-Asp) domain-containing protein
MAKSQSRVAAVVALTLTLVLSTDHATHAGYCFTAWVTGYNLNDPRMNPTTADGTPRWSQEAIVATWLINGRTPGVPFGSTVEIERLGTFTVKDTCPGCGQGHFDVGMQSDDAALGITGFYDVCVTQ